MPPFLLTGIALSIGSALTWPAVLRDRRQWRVTGPVLCLGVVTLFGFHFFLFIALRIAPAVEVNLVNYAWPLLMVVLSPLYLPGEKLRGVHVVAALVGLAGATLAILAGRNAGAVVVSPSRFGPALGYLLAVGSGFLWANYSLQTKRLALANRSFPAAAIGLFGLISGLLSLLCHVFLEDGVALSQRDWFLMATMGLGPLGAAFLLWDAALKNGKASAIGIMSYITPLASTLLLMAFTGRALTWTIALAAALIVGAAVVGTRRG